MKSARTKEKKLVRRRLVHSYITSVISISLVLTLMGAVAVFWTSAGNVAAYFKENMPVSVILEDDITESEALAFAGTLNASPDVRKAVYVSREQGTEELKGLLGEDFLSVFETTPVPASIDIFFKGTAISKEALSAFSGRMDEDDRVVEVVWQENLVEALNSNLRQIAMVLGIVIALLLVISFALINNTVRLNIFARRFTIHTMMMVGARRSFIRKPFVRQALLQGAVSGILASSILAGGMWYMKTRSAMLFSLFDPHTVIAAICGLIVAGMVICAVSAFFVVGRLARYSKKDEIYI